MERMRHELLPRTCFSVDENRNIRVCIALDIFLEADDGRSIADDIAACIIGNQTASLKICTDFSADSLQGTDVMNEAEGAGCRGTQLQRKGIYKELPLIDGDQLVDVGSLFPKDLFQVERAEEGGVATRSMFRA